MSLRNLSCSWQQLAKVDGGLTSLLIDKPGLTSHKIAVNETVGENDGLYQFLKDEYLLSLETVSYWTVELPSTGFNQIGVFARSNTFCKVDLIPGVTGVIAKIEDAEIFEGLNDFSIINCNGKNKKLCSYVMLGPISFVSSSCKPNAEWFRDGKL